MISIEKEKNEYRGCLLCNVRGDNIFKIIVSNKLNAVEFEELHLCKDCCKELGGLLNLTQLKDFKMVSIDDVDK